MFGTELNGLTLETFKDQLVQLQLFPDQLGQQVLMDSFMFQQLHQAVPLLEMYGSTQTTHATTFTTIPIGLSGLTLILVLQALLVQLVLLV
jgi:hypothetical protein